MLEAITNQQHTYNKFWSMMYIINLETSRIYLFLFHWWDLLTND